MALQPVFPTRKRTSGLGVAAKLQILCLLAGLAGMFCMDCVSVLAAGPNPVPLISQPLVPDSAAPGGPGFTLTVNGAGFVSGATVDWNGSPRTTNFVSGNQLTAIINMADIAVAGTASITVVNPAPGGGASNGVFFPITTPTPAVAFANAPGSRLPGGYAAAGDFNGDGKLDLALANGRIGGSPGTVTILLGNGDGTFTPTGQSLATGASPDSVAVGDFNGDGRLDLAVANRDSYTVTILLGNGDGTFTATALSPATGILPASLAVGDFNGDGKLDLAVANSYVSSSNLTILLGNGDGTFTPSVLSPATGILPASLAVGDFNGDGRLDLAVANRDSYTVTILLGNGDGTFTASPLSPVAGSLSFVAVGDFNGDGKLDLAVASSFGGLLIFLGNGDGTFTPTGHPLDSGSTGGGFVVVGDFNGDGKLDLAFTHTCDSMQRCSGVSIGLGDGTGNFTISPQAPPVFPGGTLAVGDFNGDGRLDLAGGYRVLLQGTFVMTSPSFLNFINQTLETTSPAQTVTLTNTGVLELSISSIVASGDFASGDFAQTNNCPVSPSTLAVNASCTINVTFTPTDASPRTGSVVITDNASGTPQTVPLAGTGIAPVVTLLPPILTFGSQPVGSTSAAQTVTLSTDRTLRITSIASSAPFAQTNTCGTGLSDGGSCTISVTFTPTGIGTQTGTITVTDVTGTSPQTVGLTGTGIPTMVTLSPPSLPFGSQPVGSTSVAQTVTLNTNSALSSISIATSAQFAQTNTCGVSLPAGGSCTISVTFAPTGIGTQTGTITVTDNASNSPQTVALTGTGTGPAVSLSPSGLSFGNQLQGTSSSQTVTVTNTGNIVLAISGIVSSGDYAQTNNCGGSLAAGANCSIIVTFTPTVTGTRSGTITLTDNASDSPQTVNLSGTGIAPAVTPSPASLSFTSQYVGTSGLPQNVTIMNTGTAPLTITNVQASSSFGETSGCTSSVPVGVSCTVGVFFDPTASGSMTGTLNITDSAPGSPHIVALSGMGQDFSLASAPSSSTTASVVRGQAASYTLTLAPGGGFNQTVSFTCAGAPAQSTCNVSPGVVTLSPTAATSVMVTVTTTAPSMVVPWFETLPGAPGLMITLARQRRSVPFLIWIFALALSAGTAWSCSTRARSHGLGPIRLGFGLALLFVVMLGAISMPACGGGGGGGGGGGNPGTPAGTYTLNVAGTFASGTTTLTHNVNLVLTVN